VSPELEQKLFAKYPKIFRDANKSPQESCMAFGLEVGDGWYNLIDVLCEALTYTYTTAIEVDEEDGKRLGIKPYSYKDGEIRYFFNVKPPQVVADQVKEKFGTLRFYHHLEYDESNTSLVETKKYSDLETINKRYADYFDGIIHFADIASGHTCEVTGSEGQMHSRKGWFKVLNKELTNQEKFKDYKLYKNETED